MKNIVKYLCYALVFNLSFYYLSFASQPMISDDGGTADYRQLQIYLSSNLYNTSKTNWLTAPAIEIDYGIIPRLELHLLIPYLNLHIMHIGNTSGLSDIETGFKAALILESTYVPLISIEPFIEWPTGNAKRNLGNGRAWYKFPIWLEKNWHNWKVYGGGGYIYNTEPLMKNVYYTGLVIERIYSERFQLSGEIFSETAYASNSPESIPDLGAYTVLNIGINYQLLPHFAFQIALGHSIAGVSQWYGYAGIFQDFKI